MAEPSRPFDAHHQAIATRPGTLGAIVRFWQRTYAPDYIALAVLGAGYALILVGVEPFHRMFYLNDINISYPFAEVERVPVVWNMIYAGVIPAAVIVLWLLLSRSTLHKYHVTALAFGISLLLTSFLTDVIKNAVGRPRPDLLSRCKPRAGTPDNVLVTIEVCTETNHHRLHDGWRSFPSGHSSFAFSGLGFLAIFFAGQMRVLRPRADFGDFLLSAAPLLGAAMIAISRCEDYRHDVYDVCVGSLLGFMVAYFSYRRYYPALQSSNCNEPDASRKEIFRQGFGKIKNDEEEGEIDSDVEV